MNVELHYDLISDCTLNFSLGLVLGEVFTDLIVWQK